MVRQAVGDLRVLRDQGAPPRRPHQPGDLRGGAASAAAGALRPDGRGIRSPSCWPLSIRDVDFIIPHLGSFADDWSAQLAFIEPAGRPCQHLHRHLRRAPLRPARARRWRGPGRTRCCSARTDPGCTRGWSWRRSNSSTCRRRHGARARRQLSAADPARTTVGQQSTAGIDDAGLTHAGTARRQPD